MDRRSGRRDAPDVRLGWHRQRDSDKAMSYLDDMTTAGLPMGWGTLLAGWDGPGKHGRLLNADQSSRSPSRPWRTCPRGRDLDLPIRVACAAPSGGCGEAQAGTA